MKIEPTARHWLERQKASKWSHDSADCRGAKHLAMQPVRDGQSEAAESSPSDARPSPDLLMSTLLRRSPASRGFIQRMSVRRTWSRSQS
jgi:hypothetical protein